MQNWETARETAATIVVGKGGRSKESTAARLLSSRSASTASTDSASQVEKQCIQNHWWDPVVLALGWVYW